jgi:hypothetical protein
VIEFEIPIKTVNESNGSHGHSHWPTTNRRKVQREAVAWAIKQETVFRDLPALPISVLCVRIGGSGLDPHDGLRSAFKSIVDEIAAAYGLPDNDKRFTWRYDQEKSKRGVYGVRVRIESV